MSASSQFTVLRSKGFRAARPPGGSCWTGASGPTADGGGQLIRTAFLAPDQGKRRIDRRWILTGAYDRGGRPGRDEIRGGKNQRGHWRQDRPRGGSGNSEPIDLGAVVSRVAEAEQGAAGQEGCGGPGGEHAEACPRADRQGAHADAGLDLRPDLLQVPLPTWAGNH
jgi:hypothetical protein